MSAVYMRQVEMRVEKEKRQRGKAPLMVLALLCAFLGLSSFSTAFAQQNGGNQGQAGEQNGDGNPRIQRTYELRAPELAKYMEQYQGREKTANTPQQITNRFPYSLMPPIPPGAWQSQTPGEGGRMAVDT